MTIVSPPADYETKTPSELATESAIVVEARLTHQRSYLAETNDRVLTDYLLVEPNLIAGSLPNQTHPQPAPSAPLVLTVYGGEISIEGVVVRATDVNQKPITPHTTYLLFLREARNGLVGHYEVYDGAIFEIDDSRLRPLAMHGGEAFNWTQGTSRAEVERAVRAAKVRR